MNSQDPFIEEIYSRDEKTREYRAVRYEEVVRAGLPSPPRVYPNAGTGTWEVTFAFDDAWNSYVNGTFISCILSSQMCLEQMLADFLFPNKPAGLESMSFEKLLKLAKGKGLITEIEYKAFDKLRSIRNSYTHYRYPHSNQKLGHRAYECDNSMMKVMADDARQAILALIGICRRPPFAIL